MDLSKETAALNKKYEDFIDACDRREESKNWNVEERGQMEMYISNELTCILLRLSAADGEIGEKETEFINAVLGTTYSVKEMKAVYDEMQDAIQNYSAEGIIADLASLKEEFPEMAADYAVIVCEACELLVASDGVISEDERQEAIKLMKATGI